MRKPLIVGTTIVVLVCFVGALLVLSYMDAWVASGVRQFGPKITQTKVDVDKITLSARTGTGVIRGLVIGNPTGYKEPFAMKLGEGTLTVDPGSLVGDKVVIKSIRIATPEITLEGGLQDNNLKQILANVESFTASEKGRPAEETGGKKKLQVDEFVLTNAKVNVKVNQPGVGAVDATVTIPEIRVANLGTGPEGITPAELTKAVMKQVVAQVIPAVISQTPALQNAVKGAVEKYAGKDALDKVSKGLDSLLKKN